MRHVIHDKYFLKDLLKEIDLYDRKLDHFQQHTNFETDTARNRTVKSAHTRRSNLILLAHQLMNEGIEYDQTSLPLSMQAPGAHRHVRIIQMEASKSEPTQIAYSEPEEPESIEIKEESDQTPFGAAIERLQQQAKTAGMPQVNWKDELLDYKRKRNKVPAA